MTTIEIILTIALILAVLLILHMREKKNELSCRLNDSDRILQDITTENVQLKKLKQIYEQVCLRGLGDWIIIDTGVSFLVCKRELQHDRIAIIARSYKYNAEDAADREYKKICAEELLGNLTESV